jgi:hypothetical protein
MQDYTKLSRKKKNIKLLLTYVFMVLVTVAASWAALLLVEGYSFNAGKFIQGGLVQVDTKVVSGNAYVDNQPNGQQTPVKISLSPGRHTITLKSSDYQDWSRVTDVKPSQLIWFDYVRLFPSSITTAPVNLNSQGSVISSLPAPTGKYLAEVLTGVSGPELALVDLRDPVNPKLTKISLKVNGFTLKFSANSQLTLQEWDSSEKYILLQHKDDVGNIEQLKLDVRNPDQSVNLTASFGANITDLHFVDKASNSMYGILGGELRRYDINSKNSGIISKNVTAYQEYNSSLVYAAINTSDKSSSKLEVRLRRSDSSEIIVSRYNSGESLLLGTKVYYGDIYIAVATNNQVDVYKIDAGSSIPEQITRLRRGQRTQWLTMSDEGRFVIAGSNSDYTSYDIELDQTVDTSFGSSSENYINKPQWLDDYYLVSNAGGKLEVNEYDGNSRYVIAGSAQGTPAFLSSDGKYLFSIGSDGVNNYLQVSKLVVN